MVEDGQQNLNPTGDTGQGGGDAKWYDSLPEDLKGNETLKGFDGVESLAKAHLAASGEIAGLKKQIEDGKPVIPDKPEGYGLSDKVEGFPEFLTKEASAQVSRIALAAGLTKEQASKAYEALLKEEEAILKADSDALEQLAKATKEEFQKAYGDKYEEVIGTTKQRLSQIADKAGVGGETFSKFLNETGLGENPTFVKFAIGLSKLISPDVFERNDGLGQNDGRTVAQRLYPTMSK